jgi:hypothetical protein
VPDPLPPDDLVDTADSADEAAPSFPSWAKLAEVHEGDEPAPRPASAPAPSSSSPDALLPAAYPSWARQPDDEVTPDDQATPKAEWLPPAEPAASPLAPPAGQWATPASWSTGASFGAPGSPSPFGPDGTFDPAYPKPPSFSLTPANLAFGLAAVFVVVVLAAFILRPSSSPSGQVASDIAGSCFTYNADRSRLDHAVPCDDPHDGSVLGFAADQTKCPEGTDAILTTQADTFGTNGVLCVREQP